MRNHPEPSRVRAGGTLNHNPSESYNPGLARIAALRRIVKDRQYAKVDGCMIDLFSASYIVAVYDKLNEINQARYRNLSAPRMAAIAFKLAK